MDDPLSQKIAAFRPPSFESEEEEALDPLSRRIAAFGKKEEKKGIVGHAKDLGTGLVEDPISLGLVLGGVAQSAVLDPLAALLDLPGAIGLKGLPTESVAKGLRSLSTSISRESREAALNAGLSEDQINMVQGLGKFIGFIAPVTGSIKAAQLLGGATKTGANLLTHAKYGSLVTDMVAGGIFGGAMMEGEDMGERLANASRESALFGVGRIALMTLGMPFAAYRNSRAALLLDEKAKDTLGKMVRGEAVEIATKEEAKSIFELLSSENFLSSSPGAIDLIERGLVKSAMAESVLEIVGREGSQTGIFAGAGKTFPEAAELAASFREHLPYLKFQPIKRGDRFDIFFGPNGLGPKQLKALKETGVIPGQRVWKNGSEYEMVGRSPREGYLTVKRSDGRVVQIKETGVNDFPFVQPEGDVVPDALFQDFFSYAKGELDQLAKSGGGMVSETAASGARAGSVRLDPNDRRLLRTNGAILYPEEVGIQTLSPEMAAQAGMEITASHGVVDPRLPRDVRRAMTEAGMGEMSTGATVPQVNTLGESADDLIWLGAAPELRTFQDLFAGWLADRRLPVTTDFAAVESNFSSRLREQLWKMVPEEDMKVLAKIQGELATAMEAGDVPLGAIANMKGFHLERLPEGKVLLRDINTGAEFLHASEEVAAEALGAAIRPAENVGIGELMGDAGIPALTGGFAKTNGVFSFDGRIQSEEFYRKLPFAAFRNLRDWLIQVEDMTGTQLFTKGFDALDQATTKFRARMLPEVREVQTAWKGLKRKDRIAVGEFWTSVEGSDLTLVQAAAKAKEFGLSPKQINAFVESRKIFDKWFEMSGIDPNRFVNLYYSRVRQHAEMTGGSADLLNVFAKEGVPAEYKFWAEMSRSGELANFEMDPELVMYKYVRGMMWSQDVKPHWDQLATIVGTKQNPALTIGELPAEMRQAVLGNMIPGSQNPLAEPVLPQPIRDILGEYLTIMRGAPTSSMATLQRFTMKFFDSLGIEGDARLLEEYLNAGISTMYGAAMGLRMSLVARNSVQNVWMMYTRNGGRHATTGMREAMSREGFAEAMAEGVLRTSEHGIPMADAIHEQIWSQEMRGKEGLTSMAVASGLRKLLRAGHVSQKVGEKMLIPYSSVDQMNRSWAYWWQKLHTKELFEKLDVGKITSEVFDRDALAFFSPVIKEEFHTINEKIGREAALRYIGRMGSDEANFIYGMGAQPAWMQRPAGRLAAMFGTWPLWLSELYARRMRNGDLMQQAALTARTLALTGAFANMTYQSGISMWDWIAPNSFGWAGGPAVDYAVQLKQIIEMPFDKKGQALRRMGTRFTNLSYPGQIFLKDVKYALDLETPAEMGLSLLLGRPVDRGHFALEHIYMDPPTRPVPERFEAPPSLTSENLKMLSAPLGPAPGARRTVQTPQGPTPPPLETLDMLRGF